MAKIKEEDLRLRILLDGDEAYKKLLDMAETTRQYSVRVKSLGKELENLKNNEKASAKEIKEKENQLKSAKQTLEKSEKAYESYRRTLDLNRLSISELQKHIKLTRSALNSAVPGTKNWDNLNAELKKANDRLVELRSQSISVKQSLSNLWAGLHMMKQTAEFLYNSSKQAADAFLEYDEAITGAMKTTGQSRAEMDKLVASLKKLDTKTSTAQLIGIAEIGGKLGVAGDDLLGFVSAADKLNVAMGKYLGGDPEAAISSIGKLVDIFQLSPQYGLEDSMLKVGSAMNALGMASTACEGYIVEFSKRLAGIAPSADISIDKVMGLAATLDKYGQSAETSATAIGQVIMAMYKRTETFAGIAKMSLKDFTDLLNNDVNEALLRVLSGMNDGVGLQTIVSTMSEMHLNGQRASTVLGTLSKNVEDLRVQQNLSAKEFEHGTFIMDAYNIMNESATAVMEKHKNAIHDNIVEIGEQLLPVVNGVMSVTEVGLKILGSLVELMMRHKAITIILGSTIAVLSLRVKALNLINALRARATANQIRRNYEEKISLIQLRQELEGANTASKIWLVTKQVLTGKIRIMTLVTKGLAAAIKSIPFLSVATGLLSLIAVFSSFTTKEKALDDQTNNLNNSMVDAKAKIEREKQALDDLKKAALSAAKGSEERKKAIKQLNEQYGDYLPALLSEKSSNAEIAAAIKEVNTQLERKYYLQARENDLSELASKKIEKQKESIEKLRQQFQGLLSPEESAELTKLIFDYTKAIETGTQEEVDMAVKSIDDFTSTISSRYISQQKEAAAVARKNTEESLKAIEKSTGRAVAYDASNVGNIMTSRAESSMERLASSTKQALQSFKDDMVQFVSDGNFIKDFYAAFIPDERKGKPSTTGNPFSNEEPDVDGNKAWSLNNSKKFLAAKAALTEQYNKGEIASKEEFEEQLYELEIKSLRERIESNQENGANLLKLQNELQDKIRAHNEKNAEEGRKLIEKERTAAAKSTDDKIRLENERYAKQQAKFRGNAAALEAVEKEHRRNLEKIELDALNEKMQRDKLSYDTERKQKETALKSIDTSTIAGINARKRAEAELMEFDLAYLRNLQVLLQDVAQTGILNGIKIPDEQIENLKAKLAEVLAQIGDIGQKTTDGNNLKKGTGGGSLFGVSQSDWEQLFANIEAGKFGMEDLGRVTAAIGGIAQEGFKLASQAIALTNAKENEAFEQYKKQNEGKKKLLQQRLDAGIISQEDYDEQVAALEQEEADKEADMKDKQAKRQKAMSITQAIVNTALGVTQTLAQWGIPWGLIPAGIMAAMGAAEIAMIAAQPAGYAEGGLVKTRRQQDRRPFEARLSPDKRGWVQSPTILVGEEGPEYVIPAEGVRNPALLPFLNTIEQARRSGTLRSLNMDAVYPASVSVGRAIGGVTIPDAGSPAGPGTVPAGSVSLSTESLERLLVQVLAKMDKPVPAVVSMLGKGGLVEAQETYQRMRKAGRIG